MPFEKGQSGNPGGRKRANWRKLFDAAIETDKEVHSQSIFEYAVELARKDKTVLVAVLRKCLPDLQAVQAKLEGGTPFSLIIGIVPKVVAVVPGDIKELSGSMPISMPIPIDSIIKDVVVVPKVRPNIGTPKPGEDAQSRHIAKCEPVKSTTYSGTGRPRKTDKPHPVTPGTISKRRKKRRVARAATRATAVKRKKK